LTTKELTQIADEHSRAMAEHDRAMAEINRATAENTRAIAELINGVHSLHGSIKSLETIAEHVLESTSNNAEAIAILQKEWQAYLRRQPSN
jgi:methyl-accepting chemotaxis protein